MDGQFASAFLVLPAVSCCSARAVYVPAASDGDCTVYQLPDIRGVVIDINNVPDTLVPP